MRSIARWLIAAATFVSAVAAARENEPVSLVWIAPATCPSSADVRARLAARLALIQGHAPKPMAAQATVDARDDGGFRLRLEAPDGARVLEGATCDELADATVVILALAADPQNDAPSARPAPAAPAETGAETAAETAPRTSPEKASRIELAASGDFVIDTATLGAPAPGASLGVAAASGRLRFEVDAAVFASQTTRLARAPTKGADVSLWEVDAAMCASLIERPIRLDACGGAGGGALHAEAFGVSSPRSANIARWQATASTRAAIALGKHVRLRATLSVIAPFTRDYFVVDPLGTVFQPPVVSMRAGLGAEAAF